MRENDDLRLVYSFLWLLFSKFFSSHFVIVRDILLFCNVLLLSLFLPCIGEVIIFYSSALQSFFTCNTFFNFARILYTFEIAEVGTNNISYRGVASFARSGGKIKIKGAKLKTSVELDPNFHYS